MGERIEKEEKKMKTETPPTMVELWANRKMRWVQNSSRLSLAIRCMKSGSKWLRSMDINTHTHTRIHILLRMYLSLCTHSLEYDQFASWSSIFLLYSLSLARSLFLSAFASFIPFYSSTYMCVNVCVQLYETKTTKHVCVFILLYVKATLLANVASIQSSSSRKKQLN